MKSTETIMIGAGDVGSILAGFLIKGNTDLYIVENDPKRFTDLQQNGLRIQYAYQGQEHKETAEAGRFHLSQKCQRTTSGNPRLIIVATKSYDITDELIKEINDVSGPDTVVMFTQLGLKKEIYQKLKSPSIEMVINFGANRKEGVARLSQPLDNVHKNTLPLGVNHVPSGRALDIADINLLFQSCGLSTTISSDFSLDVYRKIVVRFIYGLLAVPDSYLNRRAMVIGEIEQRPELRKFSEKLMEELNKVAEKLGHGELYTKEALAQRVAGLLNHRNSTVLDAAEGKPVETGTLEKVIEDAEACHAEVPFTKRFLDIFDDINKGNRHQAELKWNAILNEVYPGRAQQSPLRAKL